VTSAPVAAPQPAGANSDLLARRRAAREAAAAAAAAGTGAAGATPPPPATWETMDQRYRDRAAQRN